MAQCVTTLDQINPGENATVVSLGVACPGHLRKLLAFGLLPGTRVKLVQSVPVFVVESGHTRVALDRDIARSILVRRE